MDDQYVYKSFMVMEKADLDLEKFLNFPIEIRAELCYDACLAISEIHDKRIGHRDLKPENFLIFKTLNPTVHYEAKLTDFGCARVFEDW
jgi:serine/threonine protein kinase